MAARVLFITGGDPAGHPFHETGPLTRQILEEGGFDVVETDNLERVKTEGGLDEFGAIVLHGRFHLRDEPAEKGFERFVHSGKGLVIIHIASNTFEFSPRWHRLVGRVWEYGGPPPFTSSHPEPPGPFTVNITNQTHPITAGVKDFDVVQDERYQDLVESPEAIIEVLAEATLEGRTEPVAWVLTPPEGGRVFHITIGHNHTTFEILAFRELLNRAVAWVAG
jgi:hypothetical protein